MEPSYKVATPREYSDIQDRRGFSARDMGALCVETVGARGIGASRCARLRMELRKKRMSRISRIS